MIPRHIAARERGATVIPDRVVAKVAARAGREALAQPSYRAPRQPARGPEASASVHGTSARIRLAVDLPYPIDLAAAVPDLQRQVSQRVSRLTGLEVTEVVLAIRRLLTENGGGRVR